jgi:hypothetical protein
MFACLLLLRWQLCMMQQDGLAQVGWVLDCTTHPKLVYTMCFSLAEYKVL